MPFSISSDRAAGTGRRYDSRAFRHTAIVKEKNEPAYREHESVPDSHPSLLRLERITELAITSEGGPSLPRLRTYTKTARLAVVRPLFGVERNTSTLR
jgi:hypothetical protein